MGGLITRRKRRTTEHHGERVPPDQPGEIRSLRGSPCLRVRIFIAFHASTGAAWLSRLRAYARIGTAGPAMIRSRA